MNKPSGYEEARVFGEFTPPALGGHYCNIVQVNEVKTKSGKPQIVVLFDFAQQDKQPGYFQKQYDSNDKPKDQKKWPYAGTLWILVNDYEDPSKTSSKFKTFCTCVERSNNYKIVWGEGSDWGKQFKGKRIGAVYGENENEYNGRTTMRSEPRYFCSWDSVEKSDIPEAKYLSNKQTGSPAAGNQNSDFMNIPDGDDEEIPF